MRRHVRVVLFASLVLIAGLCVLGCAADPAADDGAGGDDSADTSAAISDHSARIAIIGGGVSGLAAARELHELGFSDVTVFEANEEVGGKVWTLIHPRTGQPYEVGAIVQSDQFEAIYDLAEKTGYADRPKDWLKDYPARAVVVDRDGQEIASFLQYRLRRDGSAERYSVIDELAAAPGFFSLLALGPVVRDGIYEPGFDAVLANSSPSRLATLALPMDEFMKDVPGPAGDITALRGRFSLFFNMTGYGFTSEVPALYHLKFLRLVSKVGLDQALSLATMSGMTNARRGYQDLFIHLKNWLVERGVKVRVGHRVTQVVRPEQGWGITGQRNRVSFHVRGEPDDAQHEEEFDVTIIATPPHAARRFVAQPSPVEAEMLDKVRYYNFVTTIFEGSQLDQWRSSTAFVEDHALDAGSARDSHVIGLYNNDGSDVFTAYQFAPADADPETLRAALIRDVERLGGRVDQILLVQPWRDYFPHYDTETLVSHDGRFLADCLALQGRRNTLYLTANLNFESTEHMAAFARHMIRRFFR